IMDQSEKNSLKSEFYFMAGKTAGYGSGYDVFSPRIQRLLALIHERGHIIGLHPSYGTLGCPDLLKTEAANLRKAMDAAGAKQGLYNGRQHYLRWHAECTWPDWEKAGLEIDSSVGFAQHVGFRAGTCRDYPAWSWQEGRQINVTERPLIAMEGSLVSEKYMAVPLETAIGQLKMLSEIIKFFSGEFVVLWHNDSVMSLKGSYKKLLDECYR
ncbi:MAG: polysaccharide deacetylase family protein, partial [Desulfobacterales bacterium]